MNEITAKQGKEAFDTHQDILTLKKQMGIAFVELGRLLKQVRDEEHYLALGYDNFTSYVINSELGFKRRTAYYYIEIYEWFIEKLGYEMQVVAQIGYDKLTKLLPVIKKESQKLPYPELKERAEQLVVEIQELRPVDFKKKQEDGKKQEGFEDFLPPPEYFRCQNCGKWKIIVPIEDCCLDWLKVMKKKLAKKFLGLTKKN